MTCYTNMMNRLKPREDWTIYYLSVPPLWVKHFACNEKTVKKRKKQKKNNFREWKGTEYVKIIDSSPWTIMTAPYEFLN